MKRILLTVFLFFCVAPLMAQAKAQIFTEKDFQGQWRVVTYTTTAGTLNVLTGKAEPSLTEIEASGEVIAEESAKKLEAETAILQQSYLEVNGKKFKLRLKDNERSGKFKIKRDEKNNQVVVATFKDTSESTGPIVMKDGNIVLKHYSGDIYVFEKKIEVTSQLED